MSVSICRIHLNAYVLSAWIRTTSLKLTNTVVAKKYIHQSTLTDKVNHYLSHPIACLAMPMTRCIAFMPLNKQHKRA